MKIKVTSYLNVTGLKGEKILATKEGITLKDFLIDLSDRYNREIKEQLFDSDEQLKSHYLVILNGKLYWAFPDQMHTKLNDGDSIIILPPLAGG